MVGTDYTFEPNYPNPFNPQTTISYELPTRTSVEIAVFDAIGRRIAVPVNSVKDAGRHQVTFNAENLPSGVYFYRMIAGGHLMSGRMILLK